MRHFSIQTIAGLVIDIRLEESKEMKVTLEYLMEHYHVLEGLSEQITNKLDTYSAFSYWVTRFVFLRSMDVSYCDYTIKHMLEEFEEMTGMSEWIEININPIVVKSNLDYVLVSDVLDGDYGGFGK
jgi:hypothetical protein